MVGDAAVWCDQSGISATAQRRGCAARYGAEERPRVGGPRLRLAQSRPFDTIVLIGAGGDALPSERRAW